MIAPGFAGVEEQLWLWMFAMIRPGAALFAAPITGAKAVPVQLRLIIALAVGMTAVGAFDPKLAASDGLSAAWFFVIAGEIIIGVAIGFTVQIGYSAAFVAGETISNAMGLGFASMSDPQSGQSTPVIGQLLSIVATLIFLAMDGHLILISIIVQSYQTLPPGQNFLSSDAISLLIEFGGTLFVAGLMVAFPVGSALLLVQMVMGVLARSAPTMNLFAVGLPATLIMGLILLAIAAPLMIETIGETMLISLEKSKTISGGAL